MCTWRGRPDLNLLSDLPVSVDVPLPVGTWASTVTGRLPGAQSRKAVTSVGPFCSTAGVPLRSLRSTPQGDTSVFVCLYGLCLCTTVREPGAVCVLSVDFEETSPRVGMKGRQGDGDLVVESKIGPVGCFTSLPSAGETPAIVKVNRNHTQRRGPILSPPTSGFLSLLLPGKGFHLPPEVLRLGSTNRYFVEPVL